MFRKNIIIFLIVLLLTSTYANNLSKATGFLSFKKNDFPANILNYPISINEIWRATFKENKNNRMFMHTFRYKIPKGCKILKATLVLNIKNLATSYNNDTIGFVENGKILFKTTLWLKKESFNTVKKRSFNLASLPKVGSILNSLNDGDFSFYIQDDTSINSVNLFWELSGEKCNSIYPNP